MGPCCMGLKRKSGCPALSELLAGMAPMRLIGSDHRAVKTIVRIQTGLRKRVKFVPTLKNWKPVIAGSGRAENFEAALLQNLQEYQ